VAAMKVFGFGILGMADPVADDFNASKTINTGSVAAYVLPRVLAPYFLPAYPGNP